MSVQQLVVGQPLQLLLCYNYWVPNPFQAVSIVGSNVLQNVDDIFLCFSIIAGERN